MWLQVRGQAHDVRCGFLVVWNCGLIRDGELAIGFGVFWCWVFGKSLVSFLKCGKVRR